MTTRIRSGILALNASLSQVVATYLPPCRIALALASTIAFNIPSVSFYLVWRWRVFGGCWFGLVGRQWLNRLGFCMLLGLYFCAHLQDFTCCASGEV